MKPMLYIANVDEDQLDADAARDRRRPARPVPIFRRRWRPTLAELDPAEAQGVPAKPWGSRTSRPGTPGARGVHAARPAELLHERRDGDARLDHPHRAKAPQAAGVIHTDFERGLHQGRDGLLRRLRGAGRRDRAAATPASLRQEGKDYVVQDGDVMHFKFNV